MKIEKLVEFIKQTSVSHDGVTWYPARPMTYENTFLIPRIKAAWRVLTGRADAVEWDTL